MSRHKQKKKVSLINLFLMLTVLLGAGFFAYPAISNLWNSFHQSRAIAGYVSEVEDMDKKELDLMLKKAKSYNRLLVKKANRFRMSEDDRKLYNNLLNISGTGIMAYVEIPKINIRLPVYHGTKEKVLQTAIGHLEGSSMPVGGRGSHTVLSGHRGLPSAKLFSDIDQLQRGDQFNIQVLNKKMVYRVDQIRTVLPDQLKSLSIVRGKDYATLVTCTPYGINSHRLLVRGVRVRLKSRQGADNGDEKSLSGLYYIFIMVILLF